MSITAPAVMANPLPDLESDALSSAKLTVIVPNWLTVCHAWHPCYVYVCCIPTESQAHSAVFLCSPVNCLESQRAFGFL